MEREKFEAFLENEIRIQRENGKRYVMFSGIFPPSIDGEEIPVTDIQNFGERKGYRFYFQDEMQRPFYGRIKRWNECYRLICEFTPS